MSGSEDELRIMETEEDGSEISSTELAFLEKLSIHVECRPYLYNKKHPEYKHAAAKARAWEDIGAHFKISGEQVIAKWKTLRERYGKERRKLRTKKSGSGTEDFSSPWPLFHHLTFLDPFIQERKTSSNLRKNKEVQGPTLSATAILVDEEDELGLDTEEGATSSESSSSSKSNCSSGSTFTPARASNLRKRKSDDENLDPILQKIGEITDVMKHNVASQNLEVTEDDLFGKEIAAELKKIKNDKMKRVLKMKFYTLLAEAETDSIP